MAIILKGRRPGNNLAFSPLTSFAHRRYDGDTCWRDSLLPHLHLHSIRRCLLLLVPCAWLGLVPPGSDAAPYFEDGFLGLTQQELHDKLGMPQAVRDRKSALRVFTYYPITDWEKYFRKLVSPENGEDVYTFKRDGFDVRYSFSYAMDPNDQSESPTLFVRLVDIEFSPSVPLTHVPALVPEFKPPQDPGAPAFRSNIWLLVFKGSPSPDARFIVKEKSKDNLDWTLAFQLFSLQGLSDPLTTKSLVDRVEISAQSLQLVTQRQRHTHDPIMNPYSKEFADLPPPSPAPAKKIPLPKYAE